MEAITVIDTGTSSMRGILYSMSAQIIYKCQYEYTVEDNGSGSVEQDPHVFRKALLEIVRDICTYAKEHEVEITAFSLTSQRSSIIALDVYGQPLRKAIMWHDKRSTSICDEINSAHDIYSICGMEATPMFSAPKMLWLKRNEPDTYKSTYKLAGIHDYLIFLMTGNFVTDTSLASRTCLLDLEKLEWSDYLVDVFGIDRKKLCDIVSVGSVCGYTSELFNSWCGLDKPIAVISAGGDQQCAALGLGSSKQGQITVNCGTGAYSFATVKKPVFDEHHHFLCNVSAVDGYWTVEASAMSSGMVYRWFNDNFYSPDNFTAINADIKSTVLGASGVVMLPNLMGKGTPYWDSYVRGMFYNIGFNTKKKHFARAALEGIAAELSDCVEIIRRTPGDVTEINCSGGLTKSHLFNQILADMFGIPVTVKKNCEATCLGAWVSASVAKGYYKDYESALESAYLEEPQIYYPSMENNRIYNSINEARHLIYNSLDTKKISKLLETAGEGLRRNRYEQD